MSDDFTHQWKSTASEWVLKQNYLSVSLVNQLACNAPVTPKFNLLCLTLDDFILQWKSTAT